jgi:hypothetical protein
MLFSKRQTISPTVNLLLSASNALFISLKEAFSVEELFLKPYCSVANILFWFMCWYNLVYVTFSRIFGKDVRKEMGLKLVISILSPFFYVRGLFQKIIMVRIVDLAAFKTLVVRVLCFSAETFINTPVPLIIRKLSNRLITY